MRELIVGMWMAWLAYWIVSARAVKATRRRESPASRLAHVLPLLLAGFLLFYQGHGRSGWLEWRWLPASPAVAVAGAVLVAAGLLFAVWARVRIGRNWSATVTVKSGHELIRSGPYALVRHPIYTGMLLAFVGTAVALGELRGLLAVAIAFAGFWRKLRLEERWMIETFGDTYRAYRRQVRALVPYVF